MKLTYQFSPSKESPESIMELPLTEISQMFLSIANRERRSGSSLYQRKHILGTQKTAERAKELSDLNKTIPVHLNKITRGHLTQNFNSNEAIHRKNRYLVIGVGDCTANLFRPSFDAAKKIPLFYLEDEPLEQKEYYCFMVKEENQETKVRIEKITFRDGIPQEKGESIAGLKWLFCSIPLVYNHNVVSDREMALNDYDLRHTYGKNAKKFTDQLYSQMRAGYNNFVEMVEKNEAKILTAGPEVEFYHAGIGIKEDKIIVIHHIGSLRELALKFNDIGAEDAVLLDSGGSPVIWANWNKGGTIAHHVNYRPQRGAVIILEIKGSIIKIKPEKEAAK